MSWVSAAIAGGASLVGGLMGNSAAQGMSGEQNDWNKEAAQENRNFQERMSNSAHQREVADLRSAGLNPILSHNKGASTPSGGQSSAPGIPRVENALGAGVASAIDAMRMKKELETANSQIGLNTNTALAQNAAAMRDAATAKNSDMQTKALGAQIKAIMKEANVREGQADWDKQLQKFNNLNKALKNGLDSVNSAKDVFIPKMNINLKNPPWEGKLKDGTRYNKGTGEIVRP